MIRLSVTLLQMKDAENIENNLEIITVEIGILLVTKHLKLFPREPLGLDSPAVHLATVWVTA